VTPTAGVAGCERYLAVVIENDQAIGAWLLEAPEAVPSGGAAEAMMLTRMWATVEDWNARFGGTTMRLLFCAPHDMNQQNRVFQRRTAQAQAVTGERLQEMLALERAQQERRRLLAHAVVRKTWQGLGAAPPAALRAFDVAISCFAAALATEPAGSA